MFVEEGFGKKRREREGNEINSFVCLGGIGVKERKTKETYSFVAHHMLSSQIGRKMRDKREYLWWDPSIRCVSPHFSLTNQIRERKKFILSVPSPLPFFFPSLPSPFVLPNTVLVEGNETLIPLYFFKILNFYFPKLKEMRGNIIRFNKFFY